MTTRVGESRAVEVYEPRPSRARRVARARRGAAPGAHALVRRRARRRAAHGRRRRCAALRPGGPDRYSASTSWARNRSRSGVRRDELPQLRHGAVVVAKGQASSIVCSRAVALSSWSRWTSASTNSSYATSWNGSPRQRLSASLSSSSATCAACKDGCSSRRVASDTALSNRMASIASRGDAPAGSRRQPCGAVGAGPPGARLSVLRRYETTTCSASAASAGRSSPQSCSMRTLGGDRVPPMEQQRAQRGPRSAASLARGRFRPGGPPTAQGQQNPTTRAYDLACETDAA